MSASRSATTVTISADVSTGFACCAAFTQRTDSRSTSGRWRCGVGFTPARVQTSPPTKPRHDPLAASTAIIACTNTPYAFPFPTGPRPRRRCAVVGNFTSHVSCMARTCRPAQASPVRSAQPSTSFATVTFGLAKNRPARNSPPRLPPKRRKQIVLRITTCSRIAPPFYRGAHLRMTRATIPWRLLLVGCRKPANRICTASGKRKIRGRSTSDITSVHALAPSRGQALDEQRLDLLQEPPPKGGDRVVVGMLVAGNEAERHRVIRGPFQVAAGKHPGGVTIYQDAQQHGRVIGGRTRAAVAPAHRPQVQSFHHFYHEARQVPFRQPLIDRRRHQEPSLTVARSEVAHARHPGWQRIDVAILVQMPPWC